MALFADGSTELSSETAARIVAGLRTGEPSMIALTAASKIEQRLDDFDDPIALTDEEAYAVLLAIEDVFPERMSFDGARALRDALYARLGLRRSSRD